MTFSVIKQKGMGQTKTICNGSLVHYSTTCSVDDGRDIIIAIKQLLDQGFLSFNIPSSVLVSLSSLSLFSLSLSHSWESWDDRQQWKVGHLRVFLPNSESTAQPQILIILITHCSINTYNQKNFLISNIISSSIVNYFTIRKESQPFKKDGQ